MSKAEANATTEVAAWMKVDRFEKATDEEIVRYIPLIRHMIRTHDYGTDLTYDEMIAIGMVGIAVALERYDPNLNVKRSTWIAYQIDRAIRNERRKVITQRKRGSVLTCCDPDEDSPFDALAYVASDADAFAEREERELITKLLLEALNTLDEEELFVIRAIFYDGLSQVEVGKALGVSQSWISRIVKRVLKQLRYAIEAQRPNPEEEERAKQAEARKRYACPNAKE